MIKWKFVKTEWKFDISLNHLKACGCSVDGGVDGKCEKSGQCDCKDNYTNEKCDACKEGYFDYPKCEGLFPYNY